MATRAKGYLKTKHYTDESVEKPPPTSPEQLHKVKNGDEEELAVKTETTRESKFHKTRRHLRCIDASWTGNIHRRTAVVRKGAAVAGFGALTGLKNTSA